MLQIKICGITQADQGQAIAHQGATALGFICVQQSPRYISPQQIQAIVTSLPPSTERVGVFVNATLTEIGGIAQATGLTMVQLHGDESPEFCQQIRAQDPNLKLIKAFRVRHPQVLAQVEVYTGVVDSVLLDAYHPSQQGGTGRSLDWSTLQSFRPSIPWYLAGGLTPDNVLEAIAIARPDGIDLSSGVEHAPGHKDLNKTAQLFSHLRQQGLMA